jgi:hypothetical protein
MAATTTVRPAEFACSCRKCASLTRALNWGRYAEIFDYDSGRKAQPSEKAYGHARNPPARVQIDRLQFFL